MYYETSLHGDPLQQFDWTSCMTSVCSFIDFDVSPHDVPCNETYVAIGPEPCVVWCGDHFPRVYTSARHYVTITYVYRESGAALRRGFVFRYVAGALSFYYISFYFCTLHFNHIEFRGNYSATSNNMKLVHWPLMGGLLHLVYSEEGTGWGRSLPSPLLTVPNVTARRGLGRLF